LAAFIIGGFVLAACAPASAPPAARSDGASPAAAPARPKVMTIAIPSEPSGLSDKLFQAASDQDTLFEADMAYLDDTDAPHPLLAERLPTQSDGSWVVNADGTMRTTYTLKPNLKWDNGQPLTADDFVFAHAVYTDTEIPVSKRLPEMLMSSVVARDDRTVEINWREPYVGAGGLSNRELPPMPRHVLGDLWAQDKAGMLNSTFWTSPDYVGSGPYKVTTWDKGIGITFSANPHFALGKPGADTVHLLFVADANTVAARMFAGDIDVFPTATAANALTMQERWKADNGGTVYVASLKTRKLYFQFRDVPDHQKAVLDVRVRQALMHAIDRTAMATAIEGSLGQVSDTAYPRGSRLFPKIDQAIAKYPFNATRAQALLRDAGWVAGGDGLLRDGTGRTLDMEVRTIEEQDATIIADYWKQIGVSSQPRFVTGVERRNDEFRANFPATQLQSGSSGYLTILCTTCAPSPANRWTGSQNRGTYSTPEYDRLYAQQFAALDPVKRDDLLVDIERLITQDVAVGYVIHDTAPMVARNVVKGIRNATKELGNPLWNLWEWTVEDGR
jgi:peptide/nickel transport system substrate-binding protein